MNRFAVDLHGCLQHTAPTDLVFSPVGIAATLAMLRIGARGVTARQIDDVLRLGDGNDATSLGSLIASLGLGDDVTFAVANGLFTQRGYRVEPAFVRSLRQAFGVEAAVADFASDPERARADINAWVSTATHERIARLLAPGSVDPLTRLTVVNATYLRAPWQLPFPLAATRPADFHCADGAVRAVATMHATIGARHAVGQGWRAVELPYSGRAAGMLVVLPDAGTSIGDAVAAACGVGGSTSMVPQRVALSLPRFDIETTTGLVGALTALGMSSAFDLDTADFTGITDDEPMCVGGIIHQANITVDEAGTEAAAATATMVTGSGPASAPPIEFRVDHPFAFVVRDIATSSPIFLGHVGQPTYRR